MLSKGPRCSPLPCHLLLSWSWLTGPHLYQYWSDFGDGLILNLRFLENCHPVWFNRYLSAKQPCRPRSVCLSISQWQCWKCLQDDAMTGWCYDRMTLWQDDAMTGWQNDRDDETMVWQDDRMTRWPDDRMTKWLNDWITGWKLRRRLTV